MTLTTSSGVKIVLKQYLSKIIVNENGTTVPKTKLKVLNKKVL